MGDDTSLHLLQFATLGLLVLFFGACSKSGGPTRPVTAEGLILPIEGQDREGRAWHARSFQLLHELPRDPDGLLYDPGYFTVDRNQHVFVVDYGDYQIKRFDPDGTFGTSYGNGFGEGPGEFLSVSDVRVFGDSMICVTDPNGRRVSLFGADGGFKRSIATHDNPSAKFSLTAGGRSYSLSLHLSDGLLFETKRTLFSSEAVRFGRLFEDQSWANALMLDGFINTYREKLIYVPLRYNVITQFDAGGNIVYARTTPRDGQYVEPEVVPQPMAGVGVLKRVTGEPIHGSPILNGDTLYVHVRIPASFDAYDPVTGDYWFSIRLPWDTRFTSYIMYDRVYQLRDTTVAVYSMEE